MWNSEGIKILGTPVGSDQFVQEVRDSRLEEEGRLWEGLSWVLDVQCAWQILLQCAGPRCHHLLRTIPPSQSAQCEHHTSHVVFSHRITRTRVAQVVCLSCAHYVSCVIHDVFVLTLFDYSTFLSLLIIFSLIILSFLLPINFIFQDVVDKFPVHSR